MYLCPLEYKTQRSMLNRHFLRGRVLQSLYAYYQSGNTDLVSAEKNLVSNVVNTKDLFAIQLSILFEIRETASQFAELNEVKLRRQDDKSSTHYRMVNNALLQQLDDNPFVQKAIQKAKPDWSHAGELFKNVYKKIRELERYEKYIQDENPSYEKDQRFIVGIFKNQLSGNKDIRDLILEENLYWTTVYPLSVMSVIHYLKSLTEEGGKSQPLPDLFFEMEDKSSREQEELQFARRLFTETVVNSAKYEEYIKGKLENWDFDRMALLDTLILKMGICELLKFSSIPVRVILNEYIELAKEYSTEKSKIFINGILDKLIVDFRMQGILNKDDIGLEIKLEGFEA